jgi:hypothetical protein
MLDGLKLRVENYTADSLITCTLYVTQVWNMRWLITAYAWEKWKIISKVE